MSRWPPNEFRAKASHLSDEAQKAALAAAYATQDLGLPAVLTLNHLAHHTGSTYRYLRSVVERGHDPYRSFRMRKRRGGFRVIVVPEPRLMAVQRWIARHTLCGVSPHPLSFAYQTGKSVFDCATRHAGARWLVKIDVRQFFESISEIQVWRVFRELGFGPLISFEMARLATRKLPVSSLRRRQTQWQSKSSNYLAIRWYQCDTLGYLPQGAPTSPMLSNAAMVQLDKVLEELANEFGMEYTRYSDDLTFSTIARDFNRNRATQLVKSVYREMRLVGLWPHQSKTLIAPPGARKVVLGLLVDSDRPRLRREFKERLRLHAYYLSTRGPSAHASARGFDSISGLRRHFDGLVNYASSVDADFAAEIRATTANVNWPF